MDSLANSLAARDIAHLVHPQTNLQLHLEQGPAIVDHASGVWIYDDEGNSFLDSVSGLWCAPLGYAPERLARAAYDQMRKLSFAHLYRHNSHEPAIELAEKLLSIAPKAAGVTTVQVTAWLAPPGATTAVSATHGPPARVLPSPGVIVTPLRGVGPPGLPVTPPDPVTAGLPGPRA